MAVFVKISSVFFFLVFVTSVQGQGEQICLNLQREPLERSLSVTHQGPPGRRGPQGAIGPQGTRGNPGPPGQCVCGLTEDEQKRLKLLITLNRVELCPLGIKSGKIRDADMTSSSVYSSTYAAHLGRLDGSGVWLANPSEYHHGAWIQVDMKTPTTLTGVVTQGRGARAQWVTSYEISFGSSPDELEFIQDNNGNDIIFEGNTEQSSHVLNLFPRPITTRYVRLVAREFVARIAMRIEYVTC